MKKKTIVAAGGLVFNENKELLMIYRRSKWDLPKGKLDEGETIEECAIREVEEETGVQQIILGKLIQKHIMNILISGYMKM
jgi:8-oxo-dGTP pyrophosphatase MutT (NUDIX family)